MDYPEEVITAGAKGKKEARILRTAGRDYIIYGYFDIEAGRMLEKYSVLLRRESGDVEHLIIVPASGGRELVVKHVTERDPRKRSVYDEKNKRAVLF